MCYTHLTREKRYRIYVLHKAGHTQRRIEALLGLAPSGRFISTDCVT